jgi:hypothetical protein
MGRELDSEMLQRLQENYRGMSDGELLELAAKPEDLTEMAQQALRGEMAARKLKVAAAQPETGRRWASDALGTGERLQEEMPAAWQNPALPAGILGSAPTLDMAQPENSGVAAGESLLGRFHDAIEVGRACGFLEAEEVWFRIEDVAQPRAGLGMYDSPPVALNLIVKKTDRERAMAILRREMGLFPLQEVEEADPVVDDGTVGVVGTFGRREDADGVAQILDDARIWHRIRANPEGSVESEDAWTLEVREVDLVRAGDAVEKAMG